MRYSSKDDGLDQARHLAASLLDRKLSDFAADKAMLEERVKKGELEPAETVRFYLMRALCYKYGGDLGEDGVLTFPARPGKPAIEDEADIMQLAGRLGHIERFIGKKDGIKKDELMRFKRALERLAGVEEKYADSTAVSNKAALLEGIIVHHKFHDIMDAIKCGDTSRIPPYIDKGFLHDIKAQGLEDAVFETIWPSEPGYEKATEGLEHQIEKLIQKAGGFTPQDYALAGEKIEALTRHYKSDAALFRQIAEQLTPIIEAVAAATLSHDR